MAYSDHFVKGLEWLWGEGFLSPGGPEEIHQILQGTNINGKKVLDIGCGIGGIDQLLVGSYGARMVVGIDVEDRLVARARKDAELAGYSTEKIEYKVVEPGPLDFKSESFDVVFSKDVIVHVEDKRRIYEDIFRILRAGCSLVGSDWLGSKSTNESEKVKEWLDFAKLDFHFWTSIEMRKLLTELGFESIDLSDRNQWYQKHVRDEIDRVSGENRDRYIEIFGEEQANKRLQSSTLKMKVVDAGELRPTIFRARKPED